MTAVAAGEPGWWVQRRRAGLVAWAEAEAVEADERAAARFRRRAAVHRAAAPARCTCDGPPAAGSVKAALCARCGDPVYLLPR